MIKNKPPKINKRIWVTLGVTVMVSLVLLAVFFKIRIEAIKKASLTQQDALNKVWSGFDSQTLMEAQKENKDLQVQLLALLSIFDVQEGWLEEGRGRDFSIAFIEQLASVTQALKAKAQGKNITMPDLGFKEKLPANEQDANNLIKQLYGIKEVINLGMDYGINFKFVNPGDFEDVESVSGMRQATTRMQLVCPAQAAIEFVVKLSELAPLVSMEYLSLTLKDNYFDIDLGLSHMVINTEMLGIPASYQLSDDNRKYAAGLLKKMSKEQEEFTDVIRSKNPFFVVQAKEAPASKERKQVDVQEPPKETAPKFFYRGKAVLQSKEVAVIEDVTAGQSVFCGLGDRIKEYRVSEIYDEKVVLQKIDGKELVVNKE